MSRKRCRKYRPRPVLSNTVAIAINRARVLSHDDVERQMGVIRTAQLQFAQGLHCEIHWRSLADVCNLAQTLASMGLARGHDATRVIDDARKALFDVDQRHSAGGSWTLYPAELDALAWLVSLHQVQLEACSFGEFEDAMQRTGERMRQVRAGNAPPGQPVADGEFGLMRGSVAL